MARLDPTDRAHKLISIRSDLLQSLADYRSADATVDEMEAIETFWSTLRLADDEKVEAFVATLTAEIDSNF